MSRLLADLDMGSNETVDKKLVVDRIRAELEAQLATVTAAARAAHAAATDPEARPENQYDTRGLEASYLAGAQLARARELEAMIAIYKFFEVKPCLPGRPIEAGSLVKLAWNGSEGLYFVAPGGRGLTLSMAGATIQVITPKALAPNM